MFRAKVDFGLKHRTIRIFISCQILICLLGLPWLR